jgi:hypothetical protein
MSTPPVPPTQYQYTFSPPSTDVPENIRLGYRTPRSILLPPYMAINPYFVEFMDAVDAVFESQVDIPTEIIGDLRNMWVTNPALENNQIANSELIPFEAWSQPEWEILVKQVNMLGMKFSAASVLTNNDYQSIARWVGQYWFGKGTAAFINFINYCLSSSLAIEPLWTEDYVTFYPLGAPQIGTPIWEGGTWYPTSQVAITATGGLNNIDVTTLTSFFYEIANYNIVLHDIAITLDMPIVAEGSNVANVVCMGIFMVQQVPISNLYSYGAQSPPLTETDEVPTLAYTTNPGNTDLANAYLMGLPTDWIEDTQGRFWPLYDTPQQTVALHTELPTTMCGPVVPGATSAIYGPVAWTVVPTGTRSSGRLPMFSSLPVAKTAELSEVPVNMVGYTTGILVNPDGFAEFVPGSGQYTPYWTAPSLGLLLLQSGGHLLLNNGSPLAYVS